MQRDRRITTLYPTHDESEAMMLGDRVVVLRGGHTLIADGLDARLDPATRDILGSKPLVRGTVGSEPVTVRLPGVVRNFPPRFAGPLAALRLSAADADRAGR